MRIISALIVTLCMSSFAIAADAPKAPNAAPEYQPRIVDGWEILFDGKDLNAWNTANLKDTWEITKDGELHPAKGGSSIFTRQRYCDYILELDFKVEGNKKSNSGVFIRDHSTGNPVNTGLEIQILDDAAYHVKWDAMNANGALYDLVRPAVSASKPVGEWNHFKITVNGQNVTVELNDKEIVKADLSKWTKPQTNADGTHNKFPYAIGSLPQEGFIGLQNYGGAPVWFKNIRLKAITDRKPQFTGKEPIEKVLQPVGTSGEGATPAKP